MNDKTKGLEVVVEALHFYLQVQLEASKKADKELQLDLDKSVLLLTLIDYYQKEINKIKCSDKNLEECRKRLRSSLGLND